MPALILAAQWRMAISLVASIRSSMTTMMTTNEMQERTELQQLQQATVAVSISTTTLQHNSCTPQQGAAVVITWVITWGLYVQDKTLSRREKLYHVVCVVITDPTPAPPLEGRGVAAHRVLLRFLMFGLFKVDSLIYYLWELHGQLHGDYMLKIKDLTRMTTNGPRMII